MPQFKSLKAMAYLTPSSKRVASLSPIRGLSNITQNNSATTNQARLFSQERIPRTQNTLKRLFSNRTNNKGKMAAKRVLPKLRDFSKLSTAHTNNSWVGAGQRRRIAKIQSPAVRMDSWKNDLKVNALPSLHQRLFSGERKAFKKVSVKA